MSDERRAQVLAELAKHTGQRVPYTFLKETSGFIPGIERFHNLVTGIFKPAWSEYALSIVEFLNSPYSHKDETVFLDDGRWLMEYAPRAGRLSHQDNVALAKCLSDQVPVAVFKQLTSKDDKLVGSTYLVMGLGMVSRYDSMQGVFLLESATPAALGKLTRFLAEERERYEVELYTETTNQFQLTTPTELETFTLNRVKRDAAFRSIVLREYKHTCAVCGLRFHSGQLVEAQAAHIVSKNQHGADHLRNGLALCRTHHWAFDAGIFSLGDNYQLITSPILDKADVSNFDLREYAEKRIALPQNEALSPHPKALQWHRANIFRK